NTSVAPDPTVNPPLIVTGPLEKHTPPAGTTTLWYLPGASSPLQLVEPLPAPNDGTLRINAASAAKTAARTPFLMSLPSIVPTRASPLPTARGLVNSRAPRTAQDNRSPIDALRRGE